MQDEGDMYPQPNGEVMEYGIMVNPASGKEEKYTECWVDLDIESLDGESRKRGWVLKTESGEEGKGGKTKGMVARIGGYIQGVVRRGDDVSVERWKWSVEAKKWEVVVQIGELDVSEEAFEVRKEIQKGDVLKSGGGLVWECTEAFEWE